MRISSEDVYCSWNCPEELLFALAVLIWCVRNLKSSSLKSTLVRSFLAFFVWLAKFIKFQALKLKLFTLLGFRRWRFSSEFPLVWFTSQAPQKALSSMPCWFTAVFETEGRNLPASLHMFPCFHVHRIWRIWGDAIKTIKNMVCSPARASAAHEAISCQLEERWT